MNAHLLRIAKLQRGLLWLIMLILLGLLGFVAIVVWPTGGGPAVTFGLLALAVLVLQLLAVIQAFRLTIALRASFAYPIIMVIGGFIIPLLAPIMLLVINNIANKELQRHSVKVGFMGVPRSEYPKLMPGHCHFCGYDRNGIASELPCPECGGGFHRSQPRQTSVPQRA